MAKYNYDKSVLKGLGVGAFLNETKVRQKHIDEGENTIPTSVYNPNIIAKKLHPSFQIARIKEIKEDLDAKTFVLVPDDESGINELAYFKAGQYVSIAFQFDGKSICKPYSLCCSPLKAKGNNDNSYEITIKRKADGFVSTYALDNLKVNDKLLLSGPLGQFTYERLRDAKNVIGLAGGSGITPFVAMAEAIADNEEDFNLTILYGNKSHDSILLKDRLDEAAKKSNGKVKVVYVLSDEEFEGYESGLLSAELIKKYAPNEDYSIFVCGPKAMYKYEEEELKKLNLPRRRIRYELSGEYGDPSNDEKYPKEFIGKSFNVKVWIRGESQDVTCQANETLLHAMEMSGIHAPADCRSGTCGWCHSRLISGDTYIPESNDGRRLADKKFGWVHPCSTYPLSDIEIEIFPIPE